MMQNSGRTNPQVPAKMGGMFQSLSSMGMVNGQAPEWAQDWFGDAAAPDPPPDTGPQTVLTMEDLANSPKVDTTQTSLVRLPFIGTLHFVHNAAGIAQVSFIVLYWIYGMWCTFFVIMLPQYYDGKLKSYLLYLYGVIGALTICSLFRASTMNPGRVYKYMEDMATDDADLVDWTWCKVCRFMRPPRAHHCRKCNHCVLRMDHHCPWINNCVGEENHWAFYQLVFYAFVMSIMSFVLVLLQLFYFTPCTNCDKDSAAIHYQKSWTLILLVMSGLMSCASIGLVTIHHIGFVMDMTTIDWMKLQKQLQLNGYQTKLVKLPQAKYGCMKSYINTCGRGSILTWLFPCRQRKGPYSFTILPEKLETLHCV